VGAYAERSSAVRELTSVVAGEQIRGEGPAVESKSPWSGNTVGVAQGLAPEQLRRAAEGAFSVAQPFADIGWVRRGQMLRSAASRVRERGDELAELAALEVGKPITEARIEVERSAGILDFYAAAGSTAKGELFPSAEAGVAIMTRRRPVGPVLAITPWNFPFAIPTWKLAPALLCGNPVIWKPASAASACARELVACFERAGFPAGILSLVLGPGSSIDPLLDAPLGAISFTGSTAVGHQLRARLAPRGVPVQLELGGKNVAIVLDDAPPGTAEMIARAAYGFAGQKCTATSLVIATPGIYSQLEEQLAELTENVPWGDPLDEMVWGGPVIDADKAQQITEMLEGNQVVAQRSCETRAALVPPTLIRVRDRSASLASDEVFGPVLTVLAAEGPAQAMEAANDSEYGLVASIFGRDIDAVRGLCNRLEVGLIAVNRASTGLEVQAPAGGWKSSGGGDPEQGDEALRFYTENQTIYWKSQSPYGEFP